MYMHLMNIYINLRLNAVSNVDSFTCQLCVTLQIPNIFSSGSLVHLHSPPHIVVLQLRLAKALGHGYNHCYTSSDIDEQFGLCREALVFPSEHSEYMPPVPAMACMGAALYVRYSISAQRNDLQEGLDLLSASVKACPMEPRFLVDLSELLISLYHASGRIENLDESLVVLRRVQCLPIEPLARGKVCRPRCCHISKRSTLWATDRIFLGETDRTLQGIIAMPTIRTP
jgi:hypothetical protein